MVGVGGWTLSHKASAATAYKQSIGQFLLDLLKANI